MTITPTFEPTDTIWFVSPWTLAATSTTVLAIKIDVDIASVVTVLYYIDTDNIQYYVDQTKCFATQELLAASYEPM